MNDTTKTRLVADARDLQPGDVIVKALDGLVEIPGGMVVTEVVEDAAVGCGFRIKGTQNGSPMVLTPPDTYDIFDVQA
jgi:hypothetical protein